MYTIMMDKYKHLIQTVTATIMQKENYVDEIQFLLPEKYEHQNLRDYIVTLLYTDPYDNTHTKVLEVDENLYKNHLRYPFKVTKEFTSVAGNVTVWLNLINPDLENEDPFKVVRTFTTIIHIDKPNPYVDFADYENLQAMKQFMTGMRQEVDDIKDTMPTDLKIDEETDNLHLVHENTKIGDGVEIMIPYDNDLDDGDHDGIVDLDSIPDEDEESPTFIELEDDEA